MFTYCAWINAWVNNREAGHLRCHCTHYDVIVTMRKNFNYTHHHTALKCILIFHENDWAHKGLTHLPPGQNGRHFSDDIFKCIFMNETFCILIRISLTFVPKDPINNIPALVLIMAWHQSGDKRLSEPQCWPSSLMHICDTRGRWVNANSVHYISLIRSIFFPHIAEIRFHLKEYRGSSSINGKTTGSIT